jgi:hypothetical protein
MRTVLPLFRILTEQAPGKVESASSAVREDYQQRRGLPMARAVSTIVEAGLDSASGSLIDGIQRIAAFKLTAEQWGELANHSRQVLDETLRASMEKARPLADDLGVTDLLVRECSRVLEARAGELQARITKERARSRSFHRVFLRDVIKVLAGMVLGMLAGRFI